jgi:hypothetical protein
MVLQKQGKRFPEQTKPYSISKRKAGGDTDLFLQKIGNLTAPMQELTRRAEQAYASEVDMVIKKQCRDSESIERLLDGLLDFCFDDSILSLFKKLCRYYFTLDPVATAEYINFYREMWDNEMSEE